jgi:hypothetical protein
MKGHRNVTRTHSHLTTIRLSGALSAHAVEPRTLTMQDSHTGDFADAWSGAKAAASLFASFETGLRRRVRATTRFDRCVFDGERRTTP